jgi:hypothetical protein
MTKEQIVELRRLDEAASPDWSGLSHGNLYIWPYGALSTEDTDPQYNHEQAKANGELAQAARSALRRLLDEREALLGTVRNIRNGHTDRDRHCDSCADVLDAAIAKAEAP